MASLQPLHPLGRQACIVLKNFASQHDFLMRQDSVFISMIAAVEFVAKQTIGS